MWASLIIATKALEGKVASGCILTTYLPSVFVCLLAKFKLQVALGFGCLLECINVRVQVKKFSKFLSGVARLYTSEVTMCPHWFTPYGDLMEPAALTSAEIVAAQQRAGADGSCTTTGTGSETSPSLSQGLSESAVQVQVVTVDGALATGSSPTNVGAGSSATAMGVGRVADPGESGVRCELEATARGGPGESAGPSAGTAGVGVQLDGGDQVSSLSARDQVGSRDRINVIVEGTGLRSRCLPVRAKRSDAGGRQQPAGHKRMVPVKIEPKTFFANERTFIQWLGAAVLLVTLSVAMTSLGSEDTRRNARPAAIVFSVVSLVFLAYALYLFLWRDSMIRRKSAGPYNDRKGPVVLVLVLAAAMIATLVFMNTSSSGYAAVNWREYTPSITIRTGACDVLASGLGPQALPAASESRTSAAPVAAAMHSVALAPLLHPTSVVFHAGIGSWVIASPYKLALLRAAEDGTVIPPVDSNSTVTASYISTPNLNLQSIALVSPGSTVVYLGTGSGEVVGFDLANFAVQRRWDLTSVLQGSRNLLWGMAFVPSSSDPEGGTFWVTDSNRLFEVIRRKDFELLCPDQPRGLRCAVQLELKMSSCAWQVRLQIATSNSSTRVEVTAEVHVNVDLAFDLPLK